MLLTIKNWLNSTSESTEQEISVAQATAGLLFEAATADYELDATEESTLKNALRKGTNISQEEAEELFNWAKHYCLQSTSLYPFTRILNEQLKSDQKADLLQSLWQVAFADGQLDKYEEHYLRHVADLLHLSHSQFIASKLRAQQAAEAN